MPPQVKKDTGAVDGTTTGGSIKFDSTKPSCQVCGDTTTILRCSKCQRAIYCSVACQKQNWPAHKPSCGAGKPPFAIDKPFHRLDNHTWLHDRPIKAVYQLLLDAYRLRVEDDYVMLGEIHVGSLYGGASSGLPGFRRFMKHAIKKKGLLPSWWTTRHMKACEVMGMDASGDCCLKHAVEKPDIQAFYKDDLFPMQLRMLAETVLGSGPGGHDGTFMRRSMMARETGCHVPSTIVDMHKLAKQFTGQSL